MRITIFICCCALSVLFVSAQQWVLKQSFQGSPNDYRADRGKAKISSWWNVDHTDATGGFADAYKNTQPGGNNLYIDQNGYLVLQPSCTQHVNNGQCQAVQCGDKMLNGQICSCNNDTIKNGWFPWWCQLGWSSAKIISKETFQINPSGGVFVFEDVWIPRGRPLWPAIWLLPSTDPVYGGTGSPKGGTWNTWPNNGEIDIIETITDDPRVYGTLHYQCGNEFNGWPSQNVTLNDKAVKGSAYEGGLKGNVLALRNTGDNPLTSNATLGSLSTLSFMWHVDKTNGPTFTWYKSASNPIGPDGSFRPDQQIDVLVNRVGTNPISGISGDGSGSLSFGTTPFWPGSLGNSPPLTLYKGWNGQTSYGFQGYYKIQGNVKTPNVGIHIGPVSSKNPNGLGIVPEFANNGSVINGTIAELYEPYLCSMLGNWSDTTIPFPWDPVPCTNPPPGSDPSACPRDGTLNLDSGSYDSCWVVGASRGGVGWWTNSPLAADVAYAPFDPSQKWNIILNVAIGGQWPRNSGVEGEPPGSNYPDMSRTSLKMKSIKYYEMSSVKNVENLSLRN